MSRVLHCMVIATLAVAGVERAFAAGASPAAGQIQEVWQSRGIGGGGALYSASFSPFDADEVYIATDMTAVFHSTDTGRSWVTLPFSSLQGGTASTVRFTSDPEILFAVDVGDDLLTPVRSTDRGLTWQPLPGDPTFGEAFFLDVDPAGVDRVLVSDYAGLYVSDDGGGTFRLVYTAADDGAGVAVGGVLFDGDTIVAGTRDGIVVSNDGGASFSLASTSGIPAGEAIVSMAGSREGETTRLFAVTLDAADVYGGVTGAEYRGFLGVYRLDWPGTTWQRSTTGLGAEARPFFVATSRGEADVAWLAGYDGETGGPSVHRTTDGGTTWSAVFLTEGNDNVETGWCGWRGDLEWWWAETALGFAVAPTDPGRAIVTDYGFAHITENGGQSWRAAYVHPEDANPGGGATPNGRAYRGIGLQDTSAWWLEWHDDETIVAAFTDIAGMRSTDGGVSWTSGFALGLPHNSTYHVVRHPDGALYAATSSVHDIYQSTHLGDDRIDEGDGSIMISSDGGASWQELHGFGHPVMWLALDPNDIEVLYASVAHWSEGGIQVTRNLSAGSGATWSRLASPPRTEGHPLTVVVLDDGTVAASFSGRRDGSGAFTQSSGVFLSTDGGSSWADRSDPGMRRWTLDLVVDPHDPDQQTFFAAVFSHWGSAPNEVGGIYRSTDRGGQWTRISDQYRAGSMTISPTDPNEALVTTETAGLWRTGDLRGVSPSFTAVDRYPFRQPTRVFYNPHVSAEVWVTSFGNGLRVLPGAPGECQAPVIVSQPQGTMVLAGGTVDLSVAANGTAPLAYQWYRGVSPDTSQPLSGATGPSYTTAPLQMTTSFWVRVSNDCGEADSDTATASVTQPAAWTASIPAVAHAPGAEGTEWRSDVAVTNPGSAAVELTLSFWQAGGPTLTSTVSLAPGETREWRNILESLFGVGAGEVVAGSVRLEATSALLVVSRTYNQTSQGTYGQLLPAVTPADTLAPGATGLLPQLRRTEGFRTNVGAVNLGTEPSRMTVQVYSGEGAAAGSFDLSVPVRGWAQQFDAFAAAGTGDHDAAFATVEAAGGSIWAYASVVDNATGDPTTVPMVVGAGAGHAGSGAGTVAQDGPTLHVDDDNATGSEDGSALRPYSSVQSAVDAAAGGTTVLVAAGTYQWDVRVAGKSVDLIGGWVGGTADGYASGQPGDFETPGGPSVLEGSGDDAVVTLIDAGTTAVDGFTITGGGGGVENLPWTREGGGVFAMGGAPTIRGCLIEGNDTRHPSSPDADLFGGGIAAEDSDITILDSVIRANVSGRGGGISIRGGRSVLRGNQILDNVGVDDHGGGIYAAGERLEIVDNVISGNEIGRELGYGWGGGVIVFSTGEPALIARCRVGDNYAPTYGSGVFIDEGAQAVLENLLVHDNLVDVECAGGGAVAVDGGEGVGSRADLRFVTVVNNPCNSYVGGNGLRVEGLSSASVTSSIFWGNGGDDVFADDTSTVEVEYSTTEQGVAGPGNASADPLFVDVGGRDYHVMSSAGHWDASSADWVLDAVDSPAIDAGDPSLDCSAEPAPNGDRCNQGAFAGTAEASRSPGGVVAHRYHLAGIAHNPGVAGTVWRSDVGALSRAASDAEVTVSLLPAEGPTREASLLVPAGAQVEWSNVLETALGVDPEESVSGSLRLDSDLPLVVTARTYNQSAVGTYGQFLPAQDLVRTLAPGDRGWLVQLRSAGGFRTNVGALGLGEATSTVTVRLFDSVGSALGQPVVIAVGPSAWRQVNDVFAAAGAGSRDLAYASVEVEGSQVWVYASVVDGATGDPTTVPVLVMP